MGEAGSTPAGGAFSVPVDTGIVSDMMGKTPVVTAIIMPFPIIKVGGRLPKVNSPTTLLDKVRQLLQTELEHGWTATRVAADMNLLGHEGWNDNIVNTFARGQRRTVSLDEGLALLAVFGGRAKWVLQAVDSLSDELSRSAEQRGSIRREGMNE